MAVMLRLCRVGRRNRPFYRLRAADSRSPAGGRFIEELGYVDPIEKDPQKHAVLNKDRIEHWLRCGARPSDTVRSLLKSQGIEVGAKRPKGGVS